MKPFKFFALIHALFTLKYVERSCFLLQNELFLRKINFSWNQILREKNFCEKLYELSIYRFSYTTEELDRTLCELIDKIETEIQFEILRLWKRKVGKICNC